MEKQEYKYSNNIEQKFESLGKLKLFEDGEIVMNENSYINVIPLVKKGSIKVLRTDEDGREILLYYIKAGESCIMSIFGGLHNDTSKIKAVAEEKTEVLFIPIDKANLLIKENPEWVEYIFWLYHKRFEELLNVVNAVAFKKMDERLLNLIKNKSELLSTKTIVITHDQLANELGTARVVVSRLLKQMENENIVILGRNKIILV